MTFCFYASCSRPVHWRLSSQSEGRGTKYKNVFQSNLRVEARSAWTRNEVSSYTRDVTWKTFPWRLSQTFFSPSMATRIIDPFVFFKGFFLVKKRKESPTCDKRLHGLYFTHSFFFSKHLFYDNNKHIYKSLQVFIH